MKKKHGIRGDTEDLEMVVAENTTCQCQENYIIKRPRRAINTLLPPLWNLRQSKSLQLHHTAFSGSVGISPLLGFLQAKNANIRRFGQGLEKPGSTPIAPDHTFRAQGAKSLYSDASLWASAYSKVPHLFISDNYDCHRTIRIFHRPRRSHWCGHKIKQGAVHPGGVTGLAEATYSW